MKYLWAYLKSVEAKLTTKVESLISRGSVTLVTATEPTQTLQVTLNEGEVKENVEHFQPYGFSSYPKEDAEPLVLFRGGDRSHGIAVVVNDSRFRPKTLKKGDVVLHHYTDLADKPAENATARLTMTEGKLIIRINELDIRCGRSRLVINDAGWTAEGADFEWSKV